MLIKLFDYLFRANYKYIITILDTVYHFIPFFRYINDLPDSLSSLKQV